MLTPSSRLRPNETEVAAKVMDGEAIIINLTNGMYYSMDEVGGLIWELLAEGHSLGDIVSTVAGSYDVPADQVRPDVERVVTELLTEGLVLLSEQDGAGQPIQQERDQPQLPYAAPRLQKYADMVDLLALDPPMPALQDFPWKEPSRGAST